MLWTRVDRLAGTDPLVDFDLAIRARIAFAFAAIMTSTAMINAGLLLLTGQGRPGMALLGVIASVLFVGAGAVGLFLRRPNLSILLVLVVTAMAMGLAAWGNRGTIPPAAAFLPGVLLGVYFAWGGRAVFVAAFPFIAFFAAVIVLARDLAGTPLGYDPMAMLSMSVLALVFACIWIVFLGSAYRSASLEASAALEGSRKRLEEARDDTEAASRSKSEFLANMGHEIRTPLNGVLGMTRVLINEGGLSAQQADQLSLINESGESLLELLNDILDLSELEAGNLRLEQRDIDIQALIASVARTWEPLARAKGLTLSHDTEGGRPVNVRGDAVRIRQVLNNLVGNAIKFTGEGHVGIALTHTPSDEDTGGLNVRIAVTDTGIGIPEDKQAQVFEAFSQADTSTTREYGGTGLGLAICSKLAAEMGGRMSLDSELGTGSCFVLELTMPQGEAGAPEMDEGMPVPVPLKQPVRLLIVDDVMTNQVVMSALVRQSIEGDKVELEMASSGREAINKASATDFDAILMDVQMPGMDGMTAMRCIRENRRAADTQIVAVTALASADSEARLRAAGFCDYLAKPVEIAPLRRVLHRVLATDKQVA